MGIETIAAASLAASVIGGGISAMGAISSGNAAQQAAQYRAGVARNMAESAYAQGGYNAQRQGMKTGQVIGAQRAIRGASGVRTDWGSAQDTVDSTNAVGSMDEATIMYNAALKAAGLENEATLSLMEGESRRDASRWQAASTVLGTASSVGERWTTYNRAGVFG